MRTSNGVDGRPAARDRQVRQCWTCGGAPSDPAARADLDTLWLIADPDGALATRRFCQGCAPVGPVDGIECAVCGDGPLLAGELVTPDLIDSAAIDTWLRETGWLPSGPCCPKCTTTRSGTARTRTRAS